MSQQFGFRDAKLEFRIDKSGVMITGINILLIEIDRNVVEFLVKL